MVDPRSFFEAEEVSVRDGQPFALSERIHRGDQAFAVLALESRRLGRWSRIPRDTAVLGRAKGKVRAARARSPAVAGLVGHDAQKPRLQR